MTSRERLLRTISGELPDHVPVSPDTSNMIPARLTGMPFWDIYLYQRIPQWKAYIDCVKYFGFDSLMDGYANIRFDELGEIDHDSEEFIIQKKEDRIITQKYNKSKKKWSDTATVYWRDNPPNGDVDLKTLSLPNIPEKYEPIEGKREWPEGAELLKLAKEEMGEHGLVGVFCGTSIVVSQSELYDYCDDPNKYVKKAEQLLEQYEKRFLKLMSLDVKPDFICTGGSGTLINQTPQMFKELALPIVKRITRLCKEFGIPSHIHSCGPEKDLVKIVYEETDLTIIDPLEIPPMGDCQLKELKRLYGDKLVLKGNLHTTNVMLNGTMREVIEASKRAIDDAASGGRFILSTGDQCGRDTPDENIFAMIETAKTYGKY